MSVTVAVLFLLLTLPVGGVTYLLRARNVRNQLRGALRLEGPGVVVKRIRRQNKWAIGIAAAILILFAAVEAAFGSVGSLLQGALLRVVGAELPFWAALPVGQGGGSLTWVLYVPIMVGVGTGYVLGTISATQTKPILSKIRVRDVR